MTPRSPPHACGHRRGGPYRGGREPTPGRHSLVQGASPCPPTAVHRSATPHPVAGTDTREVIRENFREYLDHLLRDGFSVRHDEHLSDPDLIDPGGNPVETWREDYPYDERLDRDVYEEEKYQLQIELLKFQYWAQDTGTKHLILFEGRDAAGKGGTIKRFTEHLNPRAARVVALTKPTETERGQWYFHRYIAQLPTAGEIVLFDRSWAGTTAPASNGSWASPATASTRSSSGRPRCSRRCSPRAASRSPSCGSRSPS